MVKMCCLKKIFFLFFGLKTRISQLPEHLQTKSQTVLITSVQLQKNIISAWDAEILILRGLFDPEDLRSVLNNFIFALISVPVGTAVYSLQEDSTKHPQNHLQTKFKVLLQNPPHPLPCSLAKIISPYRIGLNLRIKILLFKTKIKKYFLQFPQNMYKYMVHRFL